MKREKRFWDFERKRIYLNTFRKEIRIEIQNTIRIDFFFFLGFKIFLFFSPLCRDFFLFCAQATKEFLLVHKVSRTLGPTLPWLFEIFFVFSFFSPPRPLFFVAFLREKKYRTWQWEKHLTFWIFFSRWEKERKNATCVWIHGLFFLLRGCW